MAEETPSKIGSSIKKIVTIRRARGKLNEGNLKGAAREIIKSKIQGAVLTKTLPFLGGVIIALLIAGLGFMAGTYAYRVFEAAAIVLTPPPKDKCADNPDKEAEQFVELLLGKPRNVIENLANEILKGTYLVWIEIIEEKQEDLGCRETEIIGLEGWTWPVPAPIRISSPFGPRVSPCEGCSSDHKGTDYVNSCGVPIYAANDGEVVIAKRNANIRSGYGVWIKIKHEYEETGATSTLYAHLIEGSMAVEVGDEVVSGQLIGLMGTTGSSTGCHLHFELYQQNRFFSFIETPVNPHEFLFKRISQQQQNQLEPPSSRGPTPQ